MVAESNILEVAIDAPRNRGLYCPPLRRALRGRIDFARDSEPQAARIARDWPEGVPGEVLGLNLATGEAYVRDAVYQAPQVRQQIERRGQRLGPEQTPLGKQNVASLLSFMHRAVQKGRARLVCGAWPGELPPVDAIKRTRPRSSVDQRLDRLTERLESFISLAGELLSTQRRR